jgi:hypothetical protein
MILDSSKKVFLVHLRRMITLIVFTLTALLIMLVGKMPKTFLGWNKYHWALAVAVIYVFVFIAEAIMDYKYIFFTIEKDKIILRYFSLGYLSPNKRSFEIPISEFVRYEIISSLGGIRKYIIIYALFKNKEATYPKVSLSLLNKKEQQILCSALDHFTKK